MKKLQKFASKENGITLIALVVTIVVLMILLGVSLTTFNDIDVLEATNVQVNTFYNDKQRMSNEVDDLTKNLDEINKVYPDDSYKYERTFFLNCKKDSVTLSNLKVNFYYIASNDGYDNHPISITRPVTPCYLVSEFASLDSNIIKTKLTPSNGRPAQYSGTTELDNSLVESIQTIILNQSIEPKYKFTSGNNGIYIENMDPGIYFVESPKVLEKGGKKYKMKPFLLNIRINNFYTNRVYQGYDITPTFEEVT